jgi:hypothetical protein
MGYRTFFYHPMGEVEKVCNPLFSSFSLCLCVSVVRKIG